MNKPLISHYLRPEIQNNSDFDDDDGYYYFFFIICHFICLFWPVVQTRHNLNCPLCTCEGKYCFLNLFLFACFLIFFFCNVTTTLFGVL